MVPGALEDRELMRAFVADLLMVETAGIVEPRNCMTIWQFQNVRTVDVMTVW